MPYKHLIKTEEGKYYKYFAGQWMDAGITEPTEEDFLTLGMDEIKISQDMLKQLKNITSSICFESYVYNHWISRNPIKICSNFFSLVSDSEGIIYYINNNGLCLFYDSLLDTWTQERNFYSYKSPTNAIIYNNKLVNFTATQIQEYNFSSKDWTIKSEILNQDIFKTTCNLDGFIYIASKDKLYIYDTYLRTWTDCYSVLFNSENVVMVPYNGSIHILSKGQHLIFDPIVKTWSHCKPYKDVECYGGAVHKEFIYLALGNEIVKFDPARKLYYPMNTIENIGEGYAMVSAQDRLHTFVNNLTDTQEVYIP